jgi:hypothetical protein
MRFKVIRRPVPETPQVKLCSNVLKQNLHAFPLVWLAPFDRQASGVGDSNCFYPRDCRR